MSNHHRLLLSVVSIVVITVSALAIADAAGASSRSGLIQAVGEFFGMPVASPVGTAGGTNAANTLYTYVAPPATRLVATTGANTGDCILTACATIAYAIGQAVAGDTISIAAGTYTQFGIVVNKNLTITGAGADTTTVQAAASPGTASDRVFTIDLGITATISNITVANGRKDGGQAGNIQNSGTLTLTSCAVTGGRAAQGGGIQSNGTLTMTECTVSGNFAPVTGGLLLLGSSTTITNSTFSGNIAAGGDAAGIKLATAATLDIINTTITKGGGGGVGLMVTTGTANLTNTIVAGNIWGDISGTITPASSFNLIGTGGAGGLTNGVNSNQVGVVNTGLGALSSNGGPTQTHPLLPGSPAIDKGINALSLQTDQRGTGFLRTVDSSPSNAADGTDIGAYEAVPCSSSPVVSNTSDSGTGSLRQAVIDASCPGDVITFQAGLTGTITLTSGEIVINKNVTINGPGANLLTVSGNNASRVFNIPGLQGEIVSISGLTIANGRKVIPTPILVQDGGAGVYNGGTLTISGCTFSNNSITGQGYGGGLFNDGGTLTVTGSTFTGNSAYDGGGLYHFSGLPATITNSTFSGNSASNWGGGLFFYLGGQLRNSTVTGNTAASGGGLYLYDMSGNTAVINSSIVAGNSAAFTPDVAQLLASVIESYNIIGIGANRFPSGLPNANNSYVGTAAAPVNPLLGPLAFNGGPTQTYALLPGSIAIDKGTNPLNLTLDQRGVGFARIVDNSPTNASDGTDVGAFEAPFAAPAPPVVTKSYRKTLNIASASQAGNVVTMNTTTPHAFFVGGSAEVATFGLYDGNFVVTGIPTPTSFTYTHTLSGLAPLGAGGSVNGAVASIPLNTTATLRLRVTNPNASTLTGIGFQDLLPAGTTVAPSAPAVLCFGTRTITAPDTIVLSGMTLVGGAGCDVTATVTGTQGGSWDNTATNVTSTESGLGPNSNTVNLVVVTETTAVVDSGNLIITDANGGTSNDNITISCSPPNLIISDPANFLNVSIPLNTITGSITVNTLGGNDTLTVDLSGCDFIPAGGLFFNGGDPTIGPGDKLNIVGGNQGLVTYNYTNAHDGSVVMSNFGTVTYTGLEPIVNSGTASDVVFNLPAGPNAATLADLGGGLSRLSGATFETTDFTNPTGSVSINRANAADTVTVNALAPNYPSLTIGTAVATFDQVTFAGALAMASGKNLAVFAARQIALSTAASDISAAGAGTISMTTASNILANAGSSLTVVNGNLTLNANQQVAPTPTAGYFYAVNVNGAVFETSGTGNIIINGRGGSDVTPGGVVTVGVAVQGVGQIRSVGAGPTAGGITINGVGGNAGAAVTDGVAVADTAGITSVSGDISITGTGGSSVSGAIPSNGLDLQGSAFITSTGTGADAASITIIANGGTVGTGASAGVLMFGLPNLSTVDGPVNITGQAGIGSGAAGNLASVGFYMQPGPIISSTGVGAGTGTITVVASAPSVPSGASQGYRQDGVVSTVNSNVTITGTAGNGSTANNGSSIRGNLTATGTANVSVTGTGGTGTAAGPNHGVNVRSGAAVSVATGALTITGTGGTSAFNDNAAFNLAPATFGTGSLNTTAPGSSITVNADTISIDTTNGTISAPNNVVTLRQKTNAVAINLGSAVDSTPNTLELSDAELDRITGGTLNIGNASSGTIAVSADITRSAATNMNLVTAGDVLISGGQVNTGGGTLFLDPGVSPFAVKPTKASTDVTASTLSFGSDLAIVINGTTVDTQYTQLNVVGAVNLTGVSLVLSGSHVPTAGQQFTIVNNDGGDAIVGTFNGLAQGVTIPNFLGAPGVNASISYTGGSGNDVVLTVDNVPPTVTSTTPLQGAINVDRNGNITLNFSEPVNIAAGGITLNCGGAVAFSPTLPQNGVTSIVIDPTNTLPAGVLCTVTGVSANIADPAGNQLDGDGNGSAGPNFALTFTTACTTNPVVTTNADSGAGSLREAVDVACPGSVVTFSPAVTGTITLTSDEIFIPKSLTVQGPGADVLNIQRSSAAGTPNFRIFNVPPGSPASIPLNVAISGLTVNNGHAPGGAGFLSGGGIRSASNLTLTNVSVTGNHAESAGGGVYLVFGAGTFIGSTFSGNTAVTGGAAIFFQGEVFGTTLKLANSTVSGNISTAGAGGIRHTSLNTNGFVGILDVLNSTIANNSGTAGGIDTSSDSGAGSGSTTRLRSTIISNNTPSNLTVSAPNGGVATVASLDFNLTSDNGGGFLTAAGDQINSNPLLAPLANYGGPTQTHALCVVAGGPHASCTGLSPAIDKGAAVVPALTTDQRGEIRPLDLPDAQFPDAAGGDGSDIGAFELQNTPPTITVHPVTRQAGSPASTQTIATVGDIEDVPTTLAVTINGGSTATVNGVTVTILANNPGGDIAASVVAACGATNASFTMLVTDSGGLTGTATLVVTVTANTAPTLTYATQTVTAGTTPTFGPATGPADNGSVSTIVLTSVTPNTGLTLSVNNSTGVVSVLSASLAGPYTVVVTATDNCGAATVATYTVNVVCPPIVLAPPTLPVGTVTVPYAQQLSAAPAGGNYTFAVTAGTLPAGITLNPGSGLLSGTPTSAGTFTFTITATGFRSCTASVAYTLVINKADTTTTVTSSSSTTTYGQSVTFTATVTTTPPATGTPLGTVSFFDGAAPIAGCQNLAYTSTTAISGTIGCTTASLGAGAHTINAQYSGSANYNASSGTTSQSVNQAVLTVSASSHTVTYGGAAPVITPTYSGFVLGDDPSDLTVQPTCTTNYTQGSGVAGSPYTATCSGGVDDNYTFVYVSGKIHVDKAILTVDADDKTRAYGTANPTLTATITGFVNGETLATSGVTGAPALSTTATPSSPVGAYPITATTGTLSSANYTFNFTPGTLTVTQAALTVRADDQTRVFGAPNPTLSYTITGFTNGENLATSGVTGVPNVSTAATQASNVGSYPITITQGTLASANYSFTFVNGTLTITPAATTTTITNAAALAVPTQAGQSYPVNWTVAAVAPSTGTPTGTVTVTASTGETCSAAVAAGTCSLVSNTPGVRTITATYTPDTGNFTGSTSQTVGHAVNLTISGNIKQFVQFGSNTNLPGVTVTLSGSSGAQTTTDANGNYSFTLTTAGGSFVVTPSGLGKTYEPISRTYTNVTSSITNADFVAYNAPGPGGNPREVRALNVTATAGQSVTMPIEVTAQGNETRFAFSLEFDQALLGIPTVACGSSVAGCTVTVNTQTPGRAGITISNFGTLTAGVREIARVTFPTTVSTAQSTPVSFGDQPVVRDIRNAQNDPLPALYRTGFISFVGGLEGDVVNAAANPAGGDGVLSNDVTILRQMALGLLAPVGTQYQRADAAPRSTLGDGCPINSTDVTQVARYNLGLDPPTLVGGPTGLNPGLCSPPTRGEEEGENWARTIRAVNTRTGAGGLVIVPIDISSQGDESAASFSLNWNPAVFSFVSAAPGSGAPTGTVLSLNTTQTASGKLGVLVDSTSTYEAGGRTMVLLTLRAASAAAAGQYPLTFSEAPTQNSVSSGEGTLLGASFQAGTILLASDAEVSLAISGRVLTPEGQGLRNAVVRLTAPDGTSRTVTTSSFGIYAFEGVAASQSAYTLSVDSRRYRFSPRTVTVTSNLTEINLTGLQ